MREIQKKNPPTDPLLPSEALSRFRPKGRMKPVQTSAEQQVRFGFQVGDLGLLIPLGMRSELVEQSKIYPLPNMPAWFRGLFNLRGNLVPVFDLKTLLGLSQSEKESAYLLVLGTGAASIGLWVDTLPQALELGKPLQQFPPLPGQLGDYNRAVYGGEEMLWIDLDFDPFFRMLVENPY